MQELPHRRRAPRVAGVCFALVGLVLTACGPAASGGAPAGAASATPGAISTVPGQAPGLPGTNPACAESSEAIVALGQIEAALRAGTLGDGFAESQIVGIQQVLVNAEQLPGRSSPLGVALQNVVSALGELGVLLNQNQPPAQLATQLASVDATVDALASACLAAG